MRIISFISIFPSPWIFKFSLLIFSFLLFHSFSYSQNKLALRKGWRTIVLTEGETVIPITAAEPNLFECWKNICKPCKGFSQDSLWILDNIANDGKLRFIKTIAYQYDTLTDEKYMNFSPKEKKEYGKNWIYDTTIVSPNQSYSSIFKQSSSLEVKVYELKELESLQFSMVLDCNKGFKNSAPIWAGLGLFGLMSGIAAPGMEEHVRYRYIGVGLGVMFMSWKIYSSHKVKTYNLAEWKPRVRIGKKR
ncbi:MAG: hypothetical protein H0X62_00435 [Bacteroidetes bacterium]|nr:hypothetical protein [Bacteroidota bacterium]